MKITMVFLISVMMSGTALAQTAGDMRKSGKTNKFIELIIGSWKLKSVVDEERKNQPSANANDQAPDRANNAMQMIEFQVENRYKLNNATTAMDSGSFRLNEQHGILYLESDADDITPSEWKITLRDNTLTMTGRGREASSRYKYIYEKVEEGVNTTKGLTKEDKRPTTR